MPGKSRHGKGKRPFQSKKKKDRLIRLTIPAQQPVVSQAREPISRLNVSGTLASASTPMAKLAAVRRRYVATELRTIGILIGIMLIILIVLALVLPR